MPFEELEHLSDRAFHVSGRTMEEMFQQAAAALYQVMQVEVGKAEDRRRLSLSANDHESLLVMYLTELLTMAELENLAVYESRIYIDDHSLAADLTLSTIIRKVDNIKAVTFSQMEIVKGNSGFGTIVVFDI